MKSLITVFAILVSTIIASAQSSQIGAITAAGSGCVGGNIRTSFSSAAINIGYPELQLLPDNRSISRSTCAIAIPVSVPAGFQLVASAASTGLSRLQGADTAKVSQELFTAGTVSTPQVTTLKSANKLYSVGRLNAAATLVKSACGQDTILRLNLSATAIKTTATSQSKLGVSKTQISLRLVPCHQ